MALYVDDQQVVPKEFALSLGISPDKYQRIVSKPSFKLDEGKVLKRRTVTSPLAKKTTYGILASFWFTDKSGLRRKLRYAESQIPRTEGNAMRYEYEPHRLNIEGQTVSFPNSPDRAIFMFLNPGNPQSPFADKTKKKFVYIDTVEETRLAAENMSDIQRALTHATIAAPEELVLVAKGIKVLRGEDYTIEDLRVRMQQYAIDPKTNKQYIRGMEDEVVRTEGRIVNMVDKGVFELRIKGNGRQWVWADGARKGEHIGEIIMNPNDNALERLFNHIKHHLVDYLKDLRDYTEVLTANRAAAAVLEEAKAEIEVPSHLSEVNTTVTLKDKIVDFEAAKTYIESKGYPKNMKLVKDFKVAVENDIVHDGNVDNFLVKLFEKK